MNAIGHITSKNLILILILTEGADDSSGLKQNLDKLSVWENDWDMEFNPNAR